MTTATMTVHEALAELKMLDHRILKAIENANFAVVNKHANTRIDGKTVAISQPGARRLNMRCP